MSKNTASYLAGFIDGEGTLDFSINKSFYKKGKLGIYYSPRLRIANTNKEIIQWIKNSFGGWIEVRESNNEKYKTCYMWSINGSNLKPILKSIYPYLRIKKQQCKVLLEKIKIQEKWSIKKNNGYIPERPNFIKKQVEGLHKEIKKLNKTGI